MAKKTDATKTPQPVFTDDQVASLKEFQAYRGWHSYTCGASGHGDLLPDRRGLICLHPNCDYVQTWAHNWTTNWSWKPKSAEGSTKL